MRKFFIHKSLYVGKGDPPFGIFLFRLGISCANLEAKPHSTLECSDRFRYQSTCVSVCDTGYERVTSLDMMSDVAYDVMCEADGSWAGAVPDCQSKCFLTISNWQTTTICFPYNKMKFICFIQSQIGKIDLYMSVENWPTNCTLFCRENLLMGGI